MIIKNIGLISSIILLTGCYITFDDPNCLKSQAQIDAEITECVHENDTETMSTEMKCKNGMLCRCL